MPQQYFAPEKFVGNRGGRCCVPSGIRQSAECSGTDPANQIGQGKCRDPALAIHDPCGTEVGTEWVLRGRFPVLGGVEKFLPATAMEPDAFQIHRNLTGERSGLQGAFHAQRQINGSKKAAVDLRSGQKRVAAGF